MDHHRSIKTAAAQAVPTNTYTMAHDDVEQAQPQQQQPQQGQQQGKKGQADGPSDEDVGLAVLDAARYGDLEDLKELAQAYGTRHLGYQQGAEHGGNTALHYGVCVMRLGLIDVGSPWTHIYALCVCA